MKILKHVPSALMVLGLAHPSLASASCFSSIQMREGGTPVFACVPTNINSCLDRAPVVLYQIYSAQSIQSLLEQGYSGSSLMRLLASNASNPSSLGGSLRYRCESTAISDDVPFRCFDIQQNVDLGDQSGFVVNGLRLTSVNQISRIKLAYPASIFRDQLTAYVCTNGNQSIQKQQFSFGSAEYHPDSSAGLATIGSIQYPGHYVLRMILYTYPLSSFQPKKKKLGFRMDPGAVAPLFRNIKGLF